MNLYERLINRKAKVAVIGLGYVGLPIAVAMSKLFEVIGFDINKDKIKQYKAGIDITDDLGDEQLQQCTVEFTADEARLSEASFYIIAVPTPIQNGHVPDLKYVEGASAAVGRHIKRGDIAVFESTVYPGVTEDICLPIIEKFSNLRGRTDFKIGYSPERINPGDKVHRLENIVKIVSGIDEEALEAIALVYSTVIQAGVHRAPSIRVAEAAKVIENAQRDVNIAFMNELAMLFSQMNIETKEVLAAASTKWNFLDFTPGLVGGHCIGIDPYYLTYKAEDEGYHSKIILNSRHINDGMGQFVANQMVKQVLRTKNGSSHVKVALLGLTYKENSRDVRNSKVVDVVKELKEYGIIPYVYDPIADPHEVYAEYGIEICQLEQIQDVSLVAIMVPHEPFMNLPFNQYASMFSKSVDEKLFFDIKGSFDKNKAIAAGLKYWSL